jgi:hypothetical protein
MYCPNCNSPLSELAAHCIACNADFSEGSSWKPVASKVETKTRPPIFSGQPRLHHAAQSIPIFLFAGPVLGLLMLNLTSDVKGSLAFTLHPLAIGTAFAVGGLPALFAGLLYCCITMILVYFFPNVIVGRSLGSLVGFFTGGVAATIFPFLFGPNTDYLYWSTLSMASGLASGFIASWLVPVGRQLAEPRLRKPSSD